MERKLFTKLDTENKFKSLYDWESDERFWEPRDRLWYTSYTLFFVVLIAFAAVIGEFVLIIAIIAFLFLWFVQASIPPERIKHTITPIGLRTFGKLYKYQNIQHYWFSEKHGIKYINFDIIEKNRGKDNPKRISLLIQNNEDNELFFNLVDKIDYGDQEEIGYNILTRVLNGKYISMHSYLPDDVVSQEEYLEELEN